MSHHLPIILILIPLFTALITGIVGLFRSGFGPIASVLSLGINIWVSISLAKKVFTSGPVHYVLGAWQAPFGIEYRIDTLNAGVLILISIIGFLAAMFAIPYYEQELKEKQAFLVPLYNLLIVGLLGMVITADAFNLYVLLEVTALTSYALLATGKGLAYWRTFQYVLIGTVGASFYLLGVGFLYAKTGTLNMQDIMVRLSTLTNSPAIQAAFGFILVGIFIKMAVFPFHSWLPGAYTAGHAAFTNAIAPLVTKVSVYVMIRVMLSVFSLYYAFQSQFLSEFLVWLAVAGMVAGSVLALGQTKLKKMLTYVIVAEIGYMLGGAWLGNAWGLSGAIYHIGADALMSSCVLMAFASLAYHGKITAISQLSGTFTKMPITMSAFLIGAFSMIGIPPTAGFVSKWLLLSGAYQAQHWGFMAGLIFSSLVNCILFFRLIEAAFFPKSDEQDTPKPTYSEAPPSMVIPTVIAAALVIGLGLFGETVLSTWVMPIIPKGL